MLKKDLPKTEARPAKTAPAANVTVQTANVTAVKKYKGTSATSMGTAGKTMTPK